MGKRDFLNTTILISALLATAVVANGDTLFRDKTALAIGHATKTGKSLHWTDCDGKNPKDYDAPPYWADASGNCKLSPDSFGLEPIAPKDSNAHPENGWAQLSIHDASFSRKLFPDAKVGDAIMLYKGQDTIKFKYKGMVQELKTKTASSE